MVIGLIDDIVQLSGKVKPLLLLVAPAPLFYVKYVMNIEIFTTKALIPFFGEISITLIYLVILPFVVTVTANAVNMLDVMNGSMSTTIIISIISIIISSFILDPLVNPFQVLTIYGIILGAMLAFHHFNKFPARIFSGDVGSILVGAMMGLAAVITRMEFITIITLLPHMINGFLIIVSIKGFKERRTIKKKPVKLNDDDTLEATRDTDAPLTLTRLILSNKPLTEKEVVDRMALLSVFAGMLAIITAILIKFSYLYI